MRWAYRLESLFQMHRYYKCYFCQKIVSQGCLIPCKLSIFGQTELKSFFGSYILSQNNWDIQKQ